MHEHVLIGNISEGPAILERIPEIRALEQPFLVPFTLRDLIITTDAVTALVEGHYGNASELVAPDKMPDRAS